MDKKIDELHFKLALKQAVTKWIDEEIYKTDITPDTQIELIDEKRMDSLWEKVKRKSKRSNAIIMKILKYAAMLLICFSLIGATVVMSVPSVRAQVENVIIEFYKENIAVTFGKDEHTPSYIEKEMKPSYIPDGWTMECETSTFIATIYTFKGKNNEIVEYSQWISDAEFSIDKNYNAKEYVIINGSEATLLKYHDGRVVLYWYDSYVFNLSGKNVDADIIIKIAESVK